MAKNVSAGQGIKTICIIGCGGFIGSHLTERLLLRNKYILYGIDISNEKIRHILKHNDFICVNADINDIKKIASYIKRSDCVISLAALCNPSLYNTIPIKVIDSAFLQHLEIINLCVRLKKWLIHFSTCEVYGRTISSFSKYEKKICTDHFVLKEDSSPLIMGPIHAQRWSYACAKQLLERFIYACGFEKGLDYTIVRPFNFIGPRMDYIRGVDGEGIPRVLACFMEALILRKTLKLVDGGKNKRTFTFIDDAIDAIELMLNKPDKAKSQIFNIGNPANETTIRNLALLMIKIYKEQDFENKSYNYTLRDVSSEDFYGFGYEDSDRRMPDISKAKRLLGWKPKIGLEAAFHKTIDYYISKYKPILKKT